MVEIITRLQRHHVHFGLMETTPLCQISLILVLHFQIIFGTFLVAGIDIETDTAAIRAEEHGMLRFNSHMTNRHSQESFQNNPTGICILQNSSK